LRIVLRPGAVVTGTLVKEGGGAALGATVELVGSAEESLGRAAVGAEGRFTIAHLPAELAELRIRRAGAAPFVRPGIRIPAAGTADLGRFVVPDGETLTVRVTDPAQRPVAGAAVWITVADLPAGVWNGRPAAVTGAAGEVVLHGLPPGRTVTVDVCRDGSMPDHLELDAVSPEPLQATLSPAVRLSGTVVDLHGAPVAGAHVFTRRNGTPYGIGDPLPPIGQGPCPAGNEKLNLETDGEGRFTLAPLEPGWYQVFAHYDGLVETILQAAEVPQGGRADLSITLRGGESTEKDVQGEDVKETFDEAGGAEAETNGAPPAGIEVSGKLSGLEPAEIAWARVEATQDHSHFIPGLVTADGSYRLGPLEPGTWKLQARSGGREAEWEVELKPDGRELTGDLVFPMVTAVSGRVTAADGTPAPYAWISFDNDSFDRSSVAARRDGTFATRLRNGTYEILTHAEGYGVEDTPRKVLVAGAPVTGLEIRLPAAATLHGHIRGLKPGEVPWLNVEGPGTLQQLTADPDGSYSLPSLYPGIWKVTINVVRLSGSWEQIENPVKVHDGETDIPLDVTFRASPAPGGSR